MKILVIGVGNPIMGDDSVGIHVARSIRQRLGTTTDAEVKELSVGGMRLVEEMLDHDEVYLVDSHASSDSQPGRIREFLPEQFKDTMHPASPHGTSFLTALELYKRLEPNRVPREIRIFTIDITEDLTFREHMSDPVREAASRLADSIRSRIEQALLEKD